MGLVNINNRDGIARDPDSMAILSVDMEKKLEHKRKIELAKSNLSIKDEMAELKKEISGIKDLLMRIVSNE